MADRSSTPLLQSYHGDDSDEAPGWHRRSQESSFSRHLRRCRRTSQRFLESRTKHFLVMGTVALDVAALLANIFIQLIACEMDEKDEPWVEDITEGLEIAGLVFSSLFLLELVACLFAFGPRGLTESIGSLIVVLRLWRLAKISEEVVLGATERMEILEQQLEDLEAENSRLRSQLGTESSNHSINE
ncbi:hypothetical protein ACHAPV_005581 [Trichoderma viride]